MTRTANIQRQLLPAMLDWFAEAPDPDAGLFGFRKLSESLGRTPWYLKTLRDEGQVAERLAKLLATSRYVSDLLEKEPAGVRMLGEDLAPLEAEQYNQLTVEEMRAAGARRDDPEAAVRAIRAVRRRELFRVAAGDSLGLIDVADVGAALSRITDATLEATLQVVLASVAHAKKAEAPPARMAVIAMGRYGGFELSYGSDADVLFVHEAAEGVDQHEASSYALAVANELRRLLALPGGDPPLEVDAGLRPEGKQGPLSRSLESHAAYYAKWSKVWEAQALLRADAVVGDPDLRQRFVELDRPAALPRAGTLRDWLARTTSWRYAGSRRASTRSGCPAAPTPTATSSSAGAASPTSSGPSSCCRCSTPRRCPGCAPRGPSRRSSPRARRSCCPSPTPTR